MMVVLDAAVLVGALLVLTKIADLILRPHQQARLQALFETATLKLSYTNVIAAARRLARRRIWRLTLLMMGLVPLQMYLSLPLLGQVLAQDPRVTPEIAGLIVVVTFFAECLAAVPAAFVLRWVLRDDSGKKTVFRYSSLLLLLVVISVVADWIVRNDVAPQTGLLRRASGLVMLASGSLGSALFIAAWVFVFALLLHALLRIFEAVAWRVVEYQKGAWAAVVAIATALLAFVDLYMRRP